MKGQDKRHIHFIGIGGAGMNPLARMALQKGYTVTGSDRQHAKNIDDINKYGADAWYPHNANTLEKKLPDIAVLSTAIYSDNEELLLLQKNNITIWHRSDMLRHFASGHKREIVISGTHGKTTTTSIITHILAQTDLDISWLIGGQPLNMEAGHHGMTDDVIIYEGDESDQSFLKSNPYIGIITSIEPDHLENYDNSFDIQIAKFQEFANRCEHLICCIDDKNVCKIIENISDKTTVHTYSKKDIEILSDLKNLTGWHNKLNAIAALKVAAILGLDDIVKNPAVYLETFGGVGRRWQSIPCEYPVTIIDDYAHHPTEVAAAISAAREILTQKASTGRLIVIFQPHLPTRIRDLWHEFAESLQGADILYLADLYLARGHHIEGINTKNFAKDIDHNDIAYIAGELYNITNAVVNRASPQDFILILGAGDITTIRESLARSLEQKLNEQN